MANQTETYTMRTSTYRCTVQSLDDKVIEMYRTQAKIGNMFGRAYDASLAASGGPTPRWTKRLRVRVRGRLGKNSPYAHLYKKGGPHYQWTSQDIRPEHASRFDVYVHEVSVPFTGR